MNLIYSINYLAPQKNSKKKVAQLQFYRESSNSVENQSETQQIRFLEEELKLLEEGRARKVLSTSLFRFPFFDLPAPENLEKWKGVR